MAKSDEKAADKAPQKPDAKPGHETVDVAFDDIIDAILGADPKTMSEDKKRRRRKRSS